MCTYQTVYAAYGFNFVECSDTYCENYEYNTFNPPDNMCYFISVGGSKITP